MLTLFPGVQKAGVIVEELAVAVRIHYLGEAAKTPKLDALQLAKGVGLSVKVLENSSLWGAIAVQDKAGRPSGGIFVREKVLQSDFYIAHLLGHFFVHIAPKLYSGDWKSGGFKEELDPLLLYTSAQDHDILVEFEANRLAAALLMPKAMFLKVLETKKTVAKTAEFFGVATVIAERRRVELDSTPPKVTVRPATKRGMDRIRQIASDYGTGKDLK